MQRCLNIVVTEEGSDPRIYKVGPLTISWCSAACLPSLFMCFFFFNSLWMLHLQLIKASQTRLSISQREMITSSGGCEIDGCSKATRTMQASTFFQIQQKISPWKFHAVQGLIFLRFEEVWTSFAGIGRTGKDGADGDLLCMVKCASKI